MVAINRLNIRHNVPESESGDIEVSDIEITDYIFTEPYYTTLFIRGRGSVYFKDTQKYTSRHMEATTKVLTSKTRGAGHVHTDQYYRITNRQTVRQVYSGYAYSYTLGPWYFGSRYLISGKVTKLGSGGTFKYSRNTVSLEAGYTYSLKTTSPSANGIYAATESVEGYTWDTYAPTYASAFYGAPTAGEGSIASGKLITRPGYWVSYGISLINSTEAGTVVKTTQQEVYEPSGTLTSSSGNMYDRGRVITSQERANLTEVSDPNNVTETVSLKVATSLREDLTFSEGWELLSETQGPEDIYDPGIGDLQIGWTDIFGEYISPSLEFSDPFSLLETIEYVEL